MCYLVLKEVIILIDEIYELFIWDSTLGQDEYEARVAKGLALAEKVHYLYPFLQPIIPGPSKSVWEPCAQVLAARSDDELEPHLPQLFEWLQDLSWPGAVTIRDRLLRFPFSRLEGWYDFSVIEALRSSDEVWLANLEEFKKEALK